MHLKIVWLTLSVLFQYCISVFVKVAALLWHGGQEAFRWLNLSTAIQSLCMTLSISLREAVKKHLPVS